MTQRRRFAIARRSMAQDLKAGRETELAAMTGYVMRKANLRARVRRW